MNERLEQLRADLIELGGQLRAESRSKYDRFNPIAEDLADWNQRATDWIGEDRGVTIYDSATLIGDVEIGEETWVGPFTLLDGSGGLRVGSYCSISTGAQILTHDTIMWSLTGGQRKPERTATSVGDNTFVGTNAVITRGVSIGSQCVIAAGAVVVSDVADRSIVAGVPASPIGEVTLTTDGLPILRYFGDRD